MLNACGGSKDTKDKDNKDAAPASEAAAAPKEKVPTMTINEADWEVKDLSPIAPMMPVSIKVPKGAKLEKNGNGGVDITLSDFYIITVSQIAMGTIKENLADDKKSTVNNTSRYKNGTVVIDDPHGFVATYQMNDEANGIKYSPESHFVYYFSSGPEGAMFSVHDDKPMSGPMVSEAAYTLDIAKKVYAIVKASAKIPHRALDQRRIPYHQRYSLFFIRYARLLLISQRTVARPFRIDQPIRREMLQPYLQRLPVYSRFFIVMKTIFLLLRLQQRKGLLHRIAVFDTAWIEVGTGSNALDANYSIWSILADPSGNVYAAGGFTDSASYIGGHSYVAKWNGTTWTTLGTGANALNANNAIYAIHQDAAGNIYAGGNFLDVNGKQYVAKWNGTTWTELGIDTIGLNAVNPIYAITTDPAGNVYAAGAFTDFVFAYNHNYVAQWTPATNTWTEVGLDSIYGLNADSSILALVMDRQNNLYATGNFTDSLGYRYVAQWNDTIWSELGKDSFALNANGSINAMITDTAGNIYVGGNFTDSLGYYYIAKWVARTHQWIELSNPATNQINILGPINALTLDSVGNVYAGGMIPDTNGNFFFVVVWNGDELLVANNQGSAPLNANDAILTMTSDGFGNVYAAGNFKDPNAFQYVAEFTGNIPSGITTVADEHLHIYPNPTSGLVFVQADHLSGTATMEIVDALGRTLYSQDAEGSTIQTHVDLSGFAPGVYTMLIRDVAGSKMTRRIVRSRSPIEDTLHTVVGGFHQPLQ
ncbi:unnamed protein product [Sphagnum jensenii]|uniref:Secretion system C-terminal sorting domain-containing protein n=1 Tax=Sphagnum jensenii TaxID=128206 RepID=A0ABP0VIU3_9BRYO